MHASGCSEHIEYAIARIVDTFPISPTENNGTCHVHFCASDVHVFRLCESRTRTRERRNPLRALPVNQVLSCSYNQLSVSVRQVGGNTHTHTHTHSFTKTRMNILTQLSKNVNSDADFGLSDK